MSRDLRLAVNNVRHGEWTETALRRHTGGNPPGGDGMDGRIRDLERDMTDVKVTLGKVETRLANIEQNMLTKGQMAIYALTGGIAVFGAGWWVVQQYLAPLVASLPK
ncbi:MAG TPA: hypothetical protein VL178_04420 [Pseudomonas sp.]|nr:hypothetical protein [Pseudomonas sp.]